MYYPLEVLRWEKGVGLRGNQRLVLRLLDSGSNFPCLPWTLILLLIHWLLADLKADRWTFGLWSNPYGALFT